MQKINSNKTIILLIYFLLNLSIGCGNQEATSSNSNHDKNYLERLDNDFPAKLRSKDVVPASDHCKQVVKESNCNIQNVGKQRSCLYDQQEKIKNCLNQYSIDWNQKEKEQATIMLSQITKLTEKTSGPLKAELVQEKDLASKAYAVSESFKNLSTQSSQLYRNFLDNSVKIFKVSIENSNRELIAEFGKFNTTDIDQLATVRHSLLVITQKVDLATSELRSNANVIKRQLANNKLLYKEFFSDYEDYFQKKQIKIAKPWETIEPELEKTLSNANEYQSSIRAKVNDARSRLDIQIDRLIAAKLDNEHRKRIAITKFATASSSFMEEINRRETTLFDAPKSFDNGLLDLETRYKEVNQFIQYKTICGDVETANGAWKQGGCVLLKAEIERANRYLKETIPTYLYAEIRKLAKINNGTHLQQAAAIKNMLKAGKVIEALSIYTNLAQIIEGEQQ
ncbi:MAG: hypothetical protein HQK52_21830 [Oligoflexia bacterium]|nr:hypothetical protein [Oligoflexia bacterium]